MSGFLWGLFLRGMKKTKKDKIQNKTTKRKEDHKMQTTKPLSPVFFYKKKKKNRQHSHNTIQIKCLKWKQHKQNTNNNQNLKLKNINYLVSIMTKTH